MNMGIYFGKDEEIELAYWNEEVDIHNWFQNLAKIKKVRFTNSKLSINIEDLNRLLVNLKNRELKYSLNIVKIDNWYEFQIKEIEKVINFLDKEQDIETELFYNSWNENKNKGEINEQ